MLLQDLTTLWTAVSTHQGTLAIAFAALFVASEIIGSVESVKASSIYGVCMAVLNTLKDQLMPAKTPPPAA